MSWCWNSSRLAATIIINAAYSCHWHEAAEARYYWLRLEFWPRRHSVVAESYYYVVIRFAVNITIDTVTSAFIERQSYFHIVRSPGYYY